MKLIMKNNIMFTALIMSILSCSEAPKSENATTASPPIETTSKAIKVESDPHWITIDSTGKMLLGNQAVDLESLENKLVDSLLVIKKATGVVPDTVLFTTKGDVLMGTRGALLDVISMALERARNAQ
jgi:biopolymer transport protein ExbD